VKEERGCETAGDRDAYKALEGRWYEEENDDHGETVQGGRDGHDLFNKKAARHGEKI